MKNVLIVFFALLVLTSCREKCEDPTARGDDVAITAITLGAENFKVKVPAPCAITILTNAPRTIASNRSAVPVTITTTAGASIKSRREAFISGHTVNFTRPVSFTVTAKDGTTTKTYTVGIAAYNATTNPYGVYTVIHLDDVRNDKRGSYKLMNTITLPNTNAAGSGAARGITDYATAGWLPIAHDASGEYSTTGGFSGTFDGAGFSIENLYINRTIALGGLFGGGSGCTIKNLAVRGTTTKTSVTITNTTTQNLYAAILVGSISGGTITNCSTAGNVTSTTGKVGGLAGHSSNGTVTNCFATGNINAGDGCAGGLIGFQSGSQVSKSYATGNATGAFSAGGLVGFLSFGGVTDCFATGNASSAAGSYGAGGLAGANSGSITNSYATGNVSTTGLYAGGLVGQSGAHTNCYRNSDAAITKDGAPFTASDASIEGITPKTRAYMQTNDFKGRLNGTSRTTWGRNDDRNDKLPYLIGVGVGK